MALQHRLDCMEEGNQKMAYKLPFWRTVPFQGFRKRKKKKPKKDSDKILKR